MITLNDRQQEHAKVLGTFYTDHNQVAAKVGVANAKSYNFEYKLTKFKKKKKLERCKMTKR